MVAFCEVRLALNSYVCRTLIIYQRKRDEFYGKIIWDRWRTWCR